MYVYGPHGFTYNVEHLPASDHDAVTVMWKQESVSLTEKQTGRSWNDYTHCKLTKALSRKKSLIELVLKLDELNDSDSL